MKTLNEMACQICDAMAANAGALGIAVSTLECGTRIIDCGVKVAGSREAGLRLAQVCMSGLGLVSVHSNTDPDMSAEHSSSLS